MAYYHAANAGVVPVATDHMQINGGFSMSNLGGWFSGGTKVTSAFVVSDDVGLGIHCTVFLVMCSQFHLLLAPKGLDTCELLIFCQGIFRNALVNLHPGRHQTYEGCNWLVCSIYTVSSTYLSFPLLPCVTCLINCQHSFFEEYWPHI